MGDVALTVPVIRGVLEANPDAEITMVSNASFEPLFFGIERLRFYGVKLKEYKGLRGLRQLFKELKQLENWDAIIDLHSVMRSWILGGFFKISGKKVFRINKGREEKADLVNKEKKKLVQLKHTTERYLDVFRASGTKGDVKSGPVLSSDPEAIERLKKFFVSNGLEKKGKWIGIAPFSVHRQKTWPKDKVKALIEQVSESGKNTIFLLGGPGESNALKELIGGNKNCWTMAGVFSLEEEIALMYELDVMLAMDSFNMHLASLCDTKTISIWGGTHHFAGFGPLNDNDKNIVEISPETLPCRPCSVFGSKPCHRGDWACLEQITVEEVSARI